MQDRINAIVYHIQTNEQMELSEKSRYDIEGHLMGAVQDATERANKDKEYWRSLYFQTVRGVNIPKVYS
ncbi:hypothetical protein LGQ02_03950 [Bacillus shivajii]|uniref:hypothetical protein n=1 Tax=Bacillus shivajii TaxID=1983719 RepID=UPI001CFA01B5|nr:hypothetical protein [Bacillus shivajii]UCZ53945.1 hypothetical protein LGQ02_03950 [Bacillus shivajii]